MENKVSITLAAAAITNITTALATIEKNLPALINLTADDRKALPKMGDKTLAFVSKALEYAKQNPTLVPTFLNMAEFEKDVTAASSLNTVLKPLQQLTEKLDDTTLQAGSEAYSAALVFYASIKSAAKAGVPGVKTINDDLQARFPGRSKTPAEAMRASSN
ncbi:MAG: hypothetical protein JXR39_08855 [Marinilabiliaceae bacterium]|nr:hypothetical protein [Marinilabiliaceae bacterium]